MPKISAGLQAANSLLNLGTGIYALYNSNREFNFQKDGFNINLANAIKSYNTNYRDRVMSRYSAADYAKNKAAIDAKVKAGELENKQID